MGVAILGATVAFMGSTSESNSQKFAVIDREEVSQKSKYVIGKTDELERKLQLGRDFFRFLDNNKTITENKAKALKNLFLDTNSDKVEQTKIDALKQEIEKSEKEYSDLSLKQNLTDQEKEKLKEYSNLVNNFPQLFKGFEYQLKEELQMLREKLGLEVNQKMKEAHNKVAKSKGFTLVFDSSVALYSPNDLTSAVIEELDKDKK